MSLTKILEQTKHIDGWTATEIISNVALISTLLDREDEETVNVGDEDFECTVPVSKHKQDMKLTDMEEPF